MSHFITSWLGENLVLGTSKKKSSADDPVESCCLLLVCVFEVLDSLPNPLEIFFFCDPLDKLLCVDCFDGFVVL